MKRHLVALGAALLLIAALVPPVAATAPGWEYHRWVPVAGGPNTPPSPGEVCGVTYETAVPGGWVDTWAGPIRDLTQQVIQHWNGTLTFALSGGHSVTIRQDYWLYGVADYAAMTETDTSTGLVEEMSATSAKTKLTDIGIAITRTDLTDWTPTALKLLGRFPIRGSGYDATSGFWNAECDFFRTYLK